MRKKLYFIVIYQWDVRVFEGDALDLSKLLNVVFFAASCRNRKNFPLQ